MVELLPNNSILEKERKCQPFYVKTTHFMHVKETCLRNELFDTHNPRLLPLSYATLNFLIASRLASRFEWLYT